MNFHYFVLILFLSLYNSAFCLVGHTLQIEALQILKASSNKDIQEIAKSITVKVKVEQTAGSGILVERKGQIYQVVTNRHVVDREKSHQILTSDGTLHKAQLIAADQENDLALVQFNSTQNYDLASLRISSSQLGDKLFAVGFPFNSNKPMLTIGPVGATSGLNRNQEAE